MLLPTFSRTGLTTAHHFLGTCKIQQTGLGLGARPANCPQSAFNRIINRVLRSLAEMRARLSTDLPTLAKVVPKPLNYSRR